jgi:hypothetical protein
MKIFLRNADISWVIKHLLDNIYYYTAQFGFSVAALTGGKTSYWTELPTLLLSVLDNPRRMGLLIKELEALAKEAPSRRLRVREKMKKWGELEVVLQTQLLSLLVCLPGKLTAMTFNNLIEGNPGPQSYEMVYLDIPKVPGEDRDFVEPDLLLLGGQHLLMVEVKTSGGLARPRAYPPGQLLNYIRLIVACQESDSEGLPKEFSHLILLPSLDMKWFTDSSKWVLGFDHSSGGKLNIDVDGCLSFGNKFVKNNRARFRQLLASTSVFCCSWHMLAQSFASASRELATHPDRESWNAVTNQLQALAVKCSKD